MKSLTQYLKEEGAGGPATAGGIYATPGNTMGAGNPTIPNPGEVGSGDVLTKEGPLKLKKKKRKKLASTAQSYHE